MWTEQFKMCTAPSGQHPTQRGVAAPTQEVGDALSQVLGTALQEVWSQPAEESAPLASSSAASETPEQNGEMEELMNDLGFLDAYPTEDLQTNNFNSI